MGKRRASVRPATAYSVMVLFPARQPGIGKMLGYAYSLHDNTFEANWERVN